MYFLDKVPWKAKYPAFGYFGGTHWHISGFFAGTTFNKVKSGVSLFLNGDDGGRCVGIGVLFPVVFENTADAV